MEKRVEQKIKGGGFASVMRFCPGCGRKGGEGSNREFTCAHCGFHLFFNVASAVTALIFDGDGRVLFSRRGRNPAKGRLDFPGGFCEPGESAEMALARELSEELCVRVRASSYAGTVPNEYLYDGVLYRTLDLAFFVKVDTPEKMIPADDVEALGWRFPESVMPSELAFDSVALILANLHKGRWIAPWSE